jgi:hypothetical protein
MMNKICSTTISEVNNPLTKNGSQWSQLCIVQCILLRPNLEVVTVMQTRTSHPHVGLIIICWIQSISLQVIDAKSRCQ